MLRSMRLCANNVDRKWMGGTRTRFDMSRNLPPVATIDPRTTTSTIRIAQPLQLDVSRPTVYSRESPDRVMVIITENTF